MLDIYAAEPGNGKGYLLCEAALRLYRQGRDVFLFLDGTQKYAEKWEALEPEKGYRLGTLHFIDREWLLNPENYPTFGAGDAIESEGGLIPGCALVVEEAHLVYANPKELDKSAGEVPVHPRILRFFRQHRHFAKTLHDGAKLEMDILIDTQDIMSLHPTIRRVCRRTYVPENMGDRGMPNSIILRKYRGAKVTGNHQSFRVSKDMSVHDYYDSIKGGAPAGVHKVDSQKRGGYIRWYHKAFLLIPVVCVGFLCWIGPKAYAVMTGHGSSAEAVQGVSSASASPAPGLSKTVCKGSGVVVDVEAKRVFYKGMWSDVGSTQVRGGSTYWDVGPCYIRFSA